MSSTTTAPTVKRTRGWVLKFQYSDGDYRYAGPSRVAGEPFGGERDLNKAHTYKTANQANIDMLLAYASRFDRTRRYPHPVPVTITETTTPGELREAEFGDAEVDGYVIQRDGDGKYAWGVTGGGYLSVTDSLDKALVYPTREAAAFVLYNRSKDATVERIYGPCTIIPVTRTFPMTTRTVEEVPAWTE